MVLLYSFIKKTQRTPGAEVDLAEKRFNVAKRNSHTGSNFDAFLKEEGIYDQVQAKALKRVLAEQLAESMEAAN